jgi:CheY-like chemotaxis protein
VLLAEDNPVNRLVAVRRLETWGHSVVAVETGRAAVERSARERFDLVLMDVQMPEMDGLAATRAIRERERERGGAALPIVAMTAHALAGDRERILESGMDDYVAKPLTADVFFDVVERVSRSLDSGEPEPAPAADETVLLEAVEHDRELLAELGSLFLEEHGALLGAIRRAAAAGDQERLRESLHTLAGSASNFGWGRADDALARLRELVLAGALEQPEGKRLVSNAVERAADEVGGLAAALARLTGVQRA